MLFRFFFLTTVLYFFSVFHKCRSLIYLDYRSLKYRSFQLVQLNFFFIYYGFKYGILLSLFYLISIYYYRQQRKIITNEHIFSQIYQKVIPQSNVKRQLSSPIIKYKTNFTNCILEAFEQKSFQKVDNDDWDIIWSQKEFIPELYEKKLAPHQKINHFKNYFELCRKDQLIKNLKKHKKNLQKEGKSVEAASYNFYPQTYVLPNEYVIFADEFKKFQSIQQSKNVWIMKPTGKSQGKGIFLFNKLSQVSQWQNHSAQPYIVQRYIADPLLIGGKKFDIRLYALVTSYNPLTIYFYRGGFARFTHCRYDESKIQNSEIHLTNVAIQKNVQGYDDTIGGKWYIEKLKLYLLSKYKEEAINQCFFKIQEIIIKTLEAMQKIMTNDKNNSFELYGFDVLLDSKLDPWLIEVNGSPSMTANTTKDHQFKMGLLDDTLTVIDMEKLLLGTQQQIGGFDLICKGKNLKSNTKLNQVMVQKISFLGTFNNRLENLKKMAKNYAPRLNSFYEGKQQQQSKRVGSGSQSHNNNSTNSSKRNIMTRKQFPAALISQAKPLGNGLNMNNISANNSINVVPKNVGRDFIIKHKIKRQLTNQNDSQY